jgi:hypothetical protein
VDGQRRRSPLRSFALGSLVGAAGAIATVARLRTRRPRNPAAGLAAFEDAPCFLEVVSVEARRRREAADHGRVPPE